MKYIFINNKSPYYHQAVSIRASLFFDGMANIDALINDAFEADGLHLIRLEEKTNTVLGTGRLNIQNEVGIVSQITIIKEFQQTGVGKKLMKVLINKCVELKLNQITLSARETVISFYKKF